MRKVSFLIIIVSLCFASLFSALGINNKDQYFSPNLDGVKDSVVIPFHIKEENLIEWKVVIVKEVGERRFRKVREYVSDNPKRKNLNFDKFFERIFAKDDSIQDPNSITWDGKDEQFKTLDDGVYYIKIEAEDRSGNKSNSNFIPVILDTKPPNISLVVEDKIFSPNGDGRKEELILDINLEAHDEFDKWVLKILNEAGEEVFQAEGDKDTLFKWNGRDAKNQLLEEGNYQVKIEADDLAGNKSDVIEEDIVLITSFEEAKLASSLKTISPNGDGYFDETELTGEISSLVGMNNWQLNIYGTNDQKVAQLNQSDDFVKKINYAGVDSEGEVLKDGIYTAKIIAAYDSGNVIESNPVDIKIDTTPPDMKVKILNNVFNPKSQVRANQVLNVEQSSVGEAQDTYKAFIKNQNGEIIFNKDFGSELPQSFTWDGFNDNKELVGGDYVYTLVGEDQVANIAVVDSREFNLITEKLNLDFQAVNPSFSPNGDGRLDKVIFDIKLTEPYKKIFQKGVISILDKDKKVVKQVELAKFQDKWEWDGKVGDGKDGEDGGRVLPDAEYFYTLQGFFSTKERVNSALKSVYLDTTPVLLSITYDNQVFSPNGDGNKDTITFGNNLKPSQLKPEQDKFSLSIKDRGGQVYQSFNWEGKIPEKIAWGGKRKNKTLAPGNLYVYEIKTVDHALNQATYRSKVFELVSEFEEIDLILDNNLVSQLPEAKVNEINLTTSLSKTNGLREIVYSLSDKSELNSMVLKRSKRLSEPFDFSKIKILPSQNYQIETEALFDSGNQPNTKKAIYIDNNFPKVKSVTEPDLFSPDGDGKNEILNLKFIAEDNHSLSRVTSWIFRKEEFKNRRAFEQSLENYKNNQVPLKTWNWAGKLGEGFEQQESWNGREDGEIKVESATEYIVFSEAEDEVGLVTINQSSFLVDILIEELADGRLKIVLNNINFKFDSDEMIGSYQKTLALLIRMLNRFPDYEVSIIGHTDSRGSDSYNDRLSKRRAQRVFDFLRRRGVNNPKRLSHTGVGESELLIKKEVVDDPNLSPDEREKLTEDNYRKNRRVEFYLKNNQEGN